MLKAKEFLRDIDDILSQPKQRVNVLYINTNCNLRCDYCYEINARDKLDKDSYIKMRDAQEFFNEIAKREIDCVSTVVIMGGEAFLDYAILLGVLNYAKYHSHKFAISITTNGTLLHKYNKKQLDYIKERIVTLEISYDGSGHDRRCFPNGASSRKVVEYNLMYLRDIGIDYKISYTVHRDNYTDLLYDMVHILEKFKPTAIKLSFACQELDDTLKDQTLYNLPEGYSYKNIKSDFVEYAKELYKLYNIPICDLSCVLCRKCDASNFEGNHYASPTKGQIYKDSRTKELFNSF